MANLAYTLTAFEGGAPVIIYVYDDWIAVDGDTEIICSYDSINPDIANPINLDDVAVFESFSIDTPVTSQSELKNAVDSQLLRDRATSYLQA